MALKKHDVNKVTDLYYEDVYKFVCSKCRDKETALEITQDTFLLFCQKKDKLVNKNIRAWLLSVAWNKCNEYFRKNKKELNYVPIEDVEDKIFVTEEYAITEEQFIDSLDEVQKRILDLLTDEEKRLFIALFINKKDIKLFAWEENISESAALMRKSRLKKKALKLYKDTYFLWLVIVFKIFY